MGYTHRYYIKENVPSESWKNYKAFCHKALELIDGKQWANCAGGDDRDTPIDDIVPVNIRGGFGEGAPYIAPVDLQLTDDKVTELAVDDNDEWSPLGKDIIWFNGDAAEGLDHETFLVDLNQTGVNFCKTARKPYDTLVLACIIAGEKFGVFDKWSSDAGTRDEMRSAFALFYKTFEEM